MDWQQFTALGIVAAAVVFLAGPKFRRRKFSFERDTHCGCSMRNEGQGSQGSIVFRARKGERPEVVVKLK